MKKILTTGWQSLAVGFRENPLPTFVALLIPLILFLGNTLLSAKDEFIAGLIEENSNLSAKIDSCGARELRTKDKIIEEYKEIERETKAALKNKKKK